MYKECKKGTEHIKHLQGCMYRNGTCVVHLHIFVFPQVWQNLMLFYIQDQQMGYKRERKSNSDNRQLYNLKNMYKKGSDELQKL